MPAAFARPAESEEDVLGAPLSSLFFRLAVGLLELDGSLELEETVGLSGGGRESSFACACRGTEAFCTAGCEGASSRMAPTGVASFACGLLFRNRFGVLEDRLGVRVAAGLLASRRDCADAWAAIWAVVRPDWYTCPSSLVSGCRELALEDDREAA